MVKSKGWPESDRRDLLGGIQNRLEELAQEKDVDPKAKNRFSFV